MKFSGQQWAWALIAAGALVVSGACSKKPAPPELQTTTGVQGEAQPISVIGCLKHGALAENTLVLLVSKADGSGGTATYDLVARPDLNAEDHVGKQVEVTGTMRSREEVASTSGAVAETPAKGTSGTPTVETKTDLDVRRIDVAKVTPTGGSCPQ
jgi:hypothetical protein